MGQKDIYVDAGSRHKGTIALKSGQLQIKDQKIVSGKIVIDMTSIKVTDLKSPKWAGKLKSHLESDDFFDTTKFPEAIFEITKVEFIKDKLYKISGDMTIRGTKKPMSFQANIEKSNVQFKTTGKMKINRMDFGVKYNSKKDFLAKAISIPKDKVIKDFFEIEFTLVAKDSKGIGFASL